jgi:hypothetical protein
MKRLLLVATSAAAGMLPSGVLATAWFAWLNWRAADGPNFPPPEVALAVCTGLAVLIAPVQLAMLAWKRASMRTAIAIGVAGGALAGFVLTRLLAMPPHRPESLLWLAIGAVQGAVALAALALGLRWSREAERATAHRG